MSQTPMGPRRMLLVVLALGACGRLGYGALEGDAGGPDRRGDAWARDSPDGEPPDAVDGDAEGQDADAMCGDGGGCAEDYRWDKGWRATLLISFSGVARLSDGVVVGGRFHGPADFGGGEHGSSSFGTFVVALDAGGEYRWDRTWANASALNLRALAASDGGVVLGGNFEGGTPVDFGGGDRGGLPGGHLFVVALDGDGGYRWDRTWPVGLGWVGGVAVAADGRVGATGFASGVADLGDGLYAGTGFFFLALRATDGATLATHRATGGGFSEGQAAAVRAGGGWIAGATLNGWLRFAGEDVASAGEYSGLVMVYGSAGEEVWGRVLVGDPASQTGVDAVAERSDGAVVAAGRVRGAVDLGSGVPTSSAGRDGYVTAWDAGGTHLWARPIAGPGTESAVALATGAGGSVLVGGCTDSVFLDLGGVARRSFGNQDGYVGRLSMEGSFTWDRRLGGPRDECVEGVAVTAGGLAIAAGRHAGAVDFGGGVRIADARRRLFVAAYAPP